MAGAELRVGGADAEFVGIISVLVNWSLVIGSALEAQSAAARIKTEVAEIDACEAIGDGVAVGVGGLGSVYSAGAVFVDADADASLSEGGSAADVVDYVNAQAKVAAIVSEIGGCNCYFIYVISISVLGII